MTYADNYNLRLATATANDVASAVDGLLVTYGQETHSTLINTTSTSFVDYTGSGITVSVASGEIVEINAWIVVSGSGVVRASLKVSEDGSDLSSQADYVFHRSDTTGFDATLNYTVISAPSAGSRQYKIRWKTSSGTAYSGRGRMTVKVFQNT